VVEGKQLDAAVNRLGSDFGIAEATWTSRQQVSGSFVSATWLSHQFHRLGWPYRE